jgi:hypothetical protein
MATFLNDLQYALRQLRKIVLVRKPFQNVPLRTRINIDFSSLDFGR